MLSTCCRTSRAGASRTPMSSQSAPIIVPPESRAHYPMRTSNESGMSVTQSFRKQSLRTHRQTKEPNGLGICLMQLTAGNRRLCVITCRHKGRCTPVKSRNETLMMSVWPSKLQILWQHRNTIMQRAPAVPRRNVGTEAATSHR